MSTGERTVDVVVVGAGAAGMTAALAAAHNGLDTLLVEKGAHYGGSTARSGGGLWVPNNQVILAAGVPDTPAAAHAYLAHITDGEVDEDLRRAFLDNGPAMLAFVLANTPLRMRWVPGYADYYPEAPGGLPQGRSIEPSPMDARLVGADLATLAPPYLRAPTGMAVTQADYRWMNLMARHPRGLLRTGRVAGRRVVSLLTRRRLLTMGQALAGGLRAGLRRAGVPVRLNTPLTGFRVERGRVVGVDTPDGPVTARRGVILTTGGFEHNERMRKEYQRAPIGTEWTVGAAENTGDGIEAGLRLGAAVAVMDDSWWGPTIQLPRGPYFFLAERTLPGCILVNQGGERFVNEAAPYVDAVHAMYDNHTDEVPHIPAWLVADQRYRNRYVFAGLGPRQPFPRHWYEFGTVRRSSTVEGLAERIEVPVEALRRTVDRFNGFAASGVDKDFGRGESAYDRYYGDPRNRPNPCLAPLARPPYYAVRVVPGDLGTKGGLRTDPVARVLREDGSVIPGLYAAGNASAPVMGRTYAGPGATLGPAMTFGYLAVQHILERDDDQ
ncbi:3-oxosteroid 1-dehydrogenase [Actinophytocola xanthii]|uniref:3-oxosteroid 1-dehydrogenase n=1 Tax=Actinophytocola xanthii TaxID=1912961 RepID=A0A1Q8CXA3_9PSEU|nr:3-oxosteroid 1-dehydrogenase [Actinophytocola xanthii]OLF18989.1 3-ketosteroid-delta-1-dehydrogenase [Actinophytocola xanthii]